MATTPNLDHIEAIIFDHDGTLVDSESITIQVVASIAAQQGAELHPDDADRFLGADLHEVFAEIERRSGKPLPDDTMKRFRAEQTAKILAGIPEIPGAAALLEGLDLPYAVASNAPVSKMLLCLEATDLLRFFDEERMISAYDVNAWKPDPAVFLAAAERLGVTPGRCLVVEDSRPGVLAGIAAGMHVLALDPDGRFDDTEGVTAVSSLGEVAQLIRRDR